MLKKLKIKIGFFGLIACFAANGANAQDLSPKPKPPEPSIEAQMLSAIGMATPQLTPLTHDNHITSIPVKLLYNGPKLEGGFILEVTLSKSTKGPQGQFDELMSQSSLQLSTVTSEINALLNAPDNLDDLKVSALIRDRNQNLILQTRNPTPVFSHDLRILRLTQPEIPDFDLNDTPNFTAVENISGKVTFPPKSRLPKNSTLHVQLLENALAGGLSMELIAEQSRPALLENGDLNFTLQRGTWDRLDSPDLSFKIWITDQSGRKVYVMRSPVSYNGPEIEYEIPLEGLRQGRNTKRGKNLRADLMAQTLVQGEAAFDPVNGIPGEARLKVQLKQDRGDFNSNPILAEQTLILRNLETRIAFSLTTDRENHNSVHLFPR